MTHRERAAAAIARRPVDRPAVQYLYTPVGFYEHGEALNDLYERYPGDFGPFARQPIPAPPASAFDAGGRYYERLTDEWGVTQEYRVYGIMGHAVDFPVQTAGDAPSYKFPPLPEHVRNPAGYRESVSRAKKSYYVFGWGGGILERMWALRGFENLMIDLADDDPEINALMDRLADYNRAQVQAAVDAGADAVSFGDDYGTQQGLLLSKETFRRAIKPRLAHMMKPARKAGRHIHFHSCGQVMDLFEDFKDLGVGSLWPQLPLYDMRDLKRALDFYGFSLAIHTDRAVTMTSGTPEDVRNAVLLENEIFKPKDGGAWFYIEADTGFPFENIRTLAETVFRL